MFLEEDENDGEFRNFIIDFISERSVLEATPKLTGSQKLHSEERAALLLAVRV